MPTYLLLFLFTNLGPLGPGEILLKTVFIKIPFFLSTPVLIFLNGHFYSHQTEMFRSSWGFSSQNFTIKSPGSSSLPPHKQKLTGSIVRGDTNIRALWCFCTTGASLKRFKKLPQRRNEKETKCCLQSRYTGSFNLIGDKKFDFTI